MTKAEAILHYKYYPLKKGEIIVPNQRTNTGESYKRLYESEYLEVTSEAGYDGDTITFVNPKTGYHDSCFPWRFLRVRKDLIMEDILI